MSQIAIRPAASSDALGIATIQVATWQHAYKGLIDQDFLDNFTVEHRQPRWHEILTQINPDRYILVAELDQAIVGFCSAGNSRDDDAAGNVGEIWAIYVLPQQQGQGVGSQLIGRAQSWLRDQGYIQATLWVLDTNQPSIDWYQSKGFQADGAHKIDGPGSLKLSEIRLVKKLA